MSRPRRLPLLPILIFVLAAAAAASEPRVSPAASARPDAAPLAGVATWVAPPLDGARALAEDELRRVLGLPPHFAVAAPVRLAPERDGSWERLADGSRLWRLRLASPGARSLNLGFSRFRLPEGARLLLFSPDLARLAGPFTAADGDGHGELWTPAVPGDELVVELLLPPGAGEAELEIAAVNRGYRDLGGAVDKSGSCNVDVACPVADPWAEQARAVAMLTLRGVRLCTGFLVDNTARDGRPLLLTAAHCGIDESDAPSLVAYWRFESPVCREPGSAASGGAGGGTLALFNSGSTWLASDAPSDFTLLELDDPVPAAAEGFLAGWNRADAAPGSALTIHHPDGDEKRISFENDPLSVTSYLANTGPGDGTHLRVADWDLGTTEPGSSGAPLFDPAGRVIGQLHGGYAACGNDLADWYGRLAVAWSGGGAPESRLSDWLDPLGTGAVAIDGRDLNATQGEPPAAPTNLGATALSATQVALAWTDNADDESGFRVEARIEGGDYALAGVVGANVTSAVVGGLAAGTPHAFRVAAFNAEGTSRYSNVAFATTLPALGPCLRDAATACLLGGRFEVRVGWSTLVGSGVARVMAFGGERAESDQSAFFYFFDDQPENFEMGVKVLDGCPINGRFWIFVSGLTNQGFEVAVRDSATGAIRRYANPQGTYPQTVGDTDALPCP
ncbi:MAG: trypsin-like peptidase domain-containing protein [Thermoanaerobaculia bacterium]|nr:trypsin-like peptidase domain-containing protein [Thermoanaerobaculia bacterium]